MMNTIRRIHFSASHRLLNYDGCCAHIHGHNYVVFFHATADHLNDQGMVIDFSVLKKRLGGWIDEHWDHGIIVSKDDRELLDALNRVEGQKIFTLDRNPTSENLADYLLNTVCPEQLSGTGVRIIRVVLWETENCCVDLSLP